MTLDDIADFIVHRLGGFPLRYSSEGHLIDLVRAELRTVSETEIRAAIVVAVSKGLVEYHTRGIASSDRTPWIGIRDGGEPL